KVNRPMLAHQAEEILRRDTFYDRNIVSSSGTARNPEHKFMVWLLFLYSKRRMILWQDTKSAQTAATTLPLPVANLTKTERKYGFRYTGTVSANLKRTRMLSKHRSYPGAMRTIKTPHFPNT